MKLFYERYIKLAHIGKGANAHVYKVRHADLGYVRAIKILNDYIEDKNERVYQSFLKECKTLLTIGNGCHPNIVRIYGPDLIDNHAIVEMDCVQGETLDSYIKEKGFMDYEEVQTFIHDIVGALAYTHHDIYKFLLNPEEDNLEPDPKDGRKLLITPEIEKRLVKKYGIAHNDLHSNNVMRRDYDGSFILLDFGLAVQDGKCIKSSRMADGNPEYQAPEKFDSEIVDPRSDVYSLGILMYEMLAGRVPFELQWDNSGKVSQRAVNDVLNHHLYTTPPSILPLRKAAFEKHNPGATYKRDYPEWLEEVIMKCLSKKPEDRYLDARALLDDINNHLAEDKDSSGLVGSLKEEVALLSQKYEEERLRAEQERWRAEEESNRADQERENYQQEKRENDRLKEELEKAKKGGGSVMNPPGANETVSKKSNKWKIAILIAIGAVCSLSYLYFVAESFNPSVPKDGMDNGVDTLAYVPPTVIDTVSSSGNEVISQLQAENEALRQQLSTLNNQKKDASTKVEYRTSPEVEQELATLRAKGKEVDKLKSENASLNQQVTKLKNQKPAAAKVEYKTPPEVEKELKRLRQENSKLNGQIQRYKQSLPG